MVKVGKSNRNPSEVFRKKQKERQKEKDKHERTKQKINQFLIQTPEQLLDDIQNLESETKKDFKKNELIKLRKLVYNSKILTNDNCNDDVSLDPEKIMKMRENGEISDSVLLKDNRNKKTIQAEIFKFIQPITPYLNKQPHNEINMINYSDINFENEEVFAEDHSDEIKNNLQSSKIDDKLTVNSAVSSKYYATIHNNESILIYTNAGKEEKKLPPLPKERRPKITIQDSYIKNYLQTQLQIQNQNQLGNNMQNNSMNYQQFLPQKIMSVNELENEKLIKKNQLKEFLNKIENQPLIKKEDNLAKKDFTQKKRFERRFEMDPLDPFPKEKQKNKDNLTKSNIINDSIVNKLFPNLDQNKEILIDNRIIAEQTTSAIFNP